MRHDGQGLRLALGGAQRRVDEQRLLERLADRLARIERSVRILENDLDFPPQALACRRARMRDVFAIDEQRARGRIFDQRQEPRERRFARPGFADDRKGASRPRARRTRRRAP